MRLVAPARLAPLVGFGRGRHIFGYSCLTLTLKEKRACRPRNGRGAG